MDNMVKIDAEKDALTKKLSEQYSQNIIGMDEYERIVEYINKIKTKREINIIEKIVQENNSADSELEALQTNERHLSIFSWRTTNVKSIHGNGGKYMSLFGTNRIIVDNLPKRRTIIEVSSIFGLTEIIVSKNIKITNKTVPIFAGIFAPNETNRENEESPELYIIGKAVFGNITIKT